MSSQEFYYCVLVINNQRMVYLGQSREDAEKVNVAGTLMVAADSPELAKRKATAAVDEHHRTGQLPA